MAEPVSVHPASAFRADVHGLRAIAVVAVILFHARPHWLPGGFLGVDVFFAISGYFITAILLRDLSAGTFSLVDFYLRRAIRILPPLAVMVVVVGVLGCLVLLPQELRYLGRSMVAAMMFAANISFYRQLDYFGGSADFHPLLHTWSLGVEEQFYLLYPLALATLFGRARAAVPVGIALASVASLLLALSLDTAHPTFVFYMLPTRAWELGAGALIATLRPDILRPAWREAVALAGCAALLLPMVSVTGDTSPYPACVVAILGVTAILHCGRGTLVGRALGVRPLLGLGAISYSLYLWHWPILSFYRIVNGSTLTDGDVAALTGAALLLAIASWVAIERPLMKGCRTCPAKIALPIAALVTIALGALGFVFYLASTAIVPLPARIKTIANVSGYRDTPDFARQGQPPCPIAVTPNPEHDPCLRLDPTRSNILVIGDSFSRQIWQPVAARNPGAHILPSFFGGCRPLFGTDGDAACREQFAYAMRHLVKPGGVDAVVLAARWSADELAYLRPTIRTLQARGARVFIVGPVVEFDSNVPELVARAILTGDPRAVSGHRLRAIERLDRQMDSIARSASAAYFSLYRAECPTAGCRIVTHSGRPLHWDWGHLTTESAMQLTETMPPVL